MAGIGFELKKLFDKEGVMQKIKAYSFSTIITVGPAIMAMCTLFMVQGLLMLREINLEERQLVASAITYAFVSSQIITSGFTMLVTRYVADQIFLKQYHKIMPSLYGCVMVCVPLTAIIMGSFYLKSPLSRVFKLLAYNFTVEMTVIWILTVYLSVLKEYKKVMLSYSIGFVVTLMSMGICFLTSYVSIVNWALFSVNVGFLMLAICLFFNISSFIGQEKGEGRAFSFLSYIDKYPGVLLCSFFYTLGLYVHNFIYWQSSSKVIIKGTYYISPSYDIPAFFAFLAMLPTMVYFVVRTEVSFYEYYEQYYSLILNGGTYNEIQHAKKTMIDTLWEELRNIVEVQLIASIVFILCGYTILYYLGAPQITILTFVILVLGSFGCSIMYIMILMLLYYDARKEAMWVALSFVVSVTLLTGIIVLKKYHCHGFGFFMGANIGLYVAFIKLNLYTQKLNYHTFCTQPVILREKKGIFTWLGEHLI